MKFVKRFLAYALVLAVLTACTGCSAVNNMRSNRLYEKAVDAFQKGEAAREKSFSGTIAYYEEALSQLEKVKEEYPSSPAAVKIKEDKAVLGYYTYDRLKSTYLPEWKKKAQAENGIYDCCIFLSEGNTGSIIDIAGKYAGTDNALAAAALDIATGEAGLVQDEYKKGAALQSIINVCFKTGDYDRAADAAALMTGDECNREAAGMFAKEGRFDTCERLIGQIGDNGEKFFAYRAYTDSASERKDTVHAVRAADMTVSLAGLLEEDNLRNSGFSSAAVAYASVGAFDRALEAVERIENPIERCRALDSVALCYIEQGRAAEGVGLLDMSYGMAVTADNEGRPEMLLDEIAWAYIKAGEYEKALYIIIENFKDTEHIKLYEYMTSNCSLLGNLIAEAGNNGQEALVDRAFREVLDLSGDTRDWNLLTYIVIPLVKDCSYERAEAAAVLIRGSGTKVQAYIEIAEGYLEGSQKELAEEAVRKACECLSGLEGDSGYISGLLSRIAGIYTDLGYWDKAEKALDEAVSQAGGIEMEDTRLRSLEGLALLYCKAGLYENGIKTLDLLKTDGWERDSVLESISEYYADDGQTDRAMEVIGLIKQPHYRGRAYTWAARKFMELQKTDKASEMLAKAFDEVSLSVDTEKGYSNEIPELFDIAAAYCDMLQKDKAASAMAKALEAVTNIRERYSAAWNLADIGVEYKKLDICEGDREREILHKIVERI